MSDILNTIDQAREILFDKGMTYPNYNKTIKDFNLTQEEMIIVAKALHLCDLELSKPIPQLKQRRRR